MKFLFFFVYISFTVADSLFYLKYFYVDDNLRSLAQQIPDLSISDDKKIEYIIKSDCKFNNNFNESIGPLHYIYEVDKYVVKSFTSKNTLDQYIKGHDKCKFKYSVVNPIIKLYKISNININNLYDINYYEISNTSIVKEKLIDLMNVIQNNKTETQNGKDNRIIDLKTVTETIIQYRSNIINIDENKSNYEISTFTIDLNNSNIYQLLSILAIQPFVSSLTLHNKKSRKLYSDMDSQYLYTQSMSTGSGFLTNMGINGYGVNIGMILTGIDRNHCFLYNRIYTTNSDGPSSSTKDGTYLASIVVGSDSYSSFNSMTSSSQLSVYLTNSLSSINTYLRYLYSYSKIISIGVLSDSCYYGSIAAAIDYFVSNNPDCIVLVPVALSTDCSSSYGELAQIKNGITVGIKYSTHSSYYSITESPSQTNAAYTSDGRIKPDVSAMGVDVNGGDYYSCDVTSYSSYKNLASLGIATSAVTLIVNFLKSKYSINYPSASLVKAMLIHSCYSGDGYSSSSFPNSYEGFGPISLDRVLYSSSNPHFRFKFHENEMLTTQNTIDYKYFVRFTQPFKVTLVWTDVISSSSSTSSSIKNDLDLSIIINGKTYYPNNGTSADHKNNVEVIMLPGISLYSENIYRTTIRIKKYSASTSQPFSIVITGDFYDSQSNSQNYYSVLEDMMIYNPSLSYGKITEYPVHIFDKQYPDDDQPSSNSGSCPNTDNNNNNNNNYQPEVIIKEKTTPSGGMVFFYFVLTFSILLMLCCGVCFYYGKYDTN